MEDIIKVIIDISSMRVKVIFKRTCHAYKDYTSKYLDGLDHMTAKEIGKTCNEDIIYSCINMRMNYDLIFEGLCKKRFVKFINNEAIVFGKKVTMTERMNETRLYYASKYGDFESLGVISSSTNPICLIGALESRNLSYVKRMDLVPYTGMIFNTNRECLQYFLRSRTYKFIRVKLDKMSYECINIIPMNRLDEDLMINLYANKDIRVANMMKNSSINKNGFINKGKGTLETYKVKHGSWTEQSKYLAITRCNNIEIIQEVVKPRSLTYIKISKRSNITAVKYLYDIGVRLAVKYIFSYELFEFLYSIGKRPYRCIGYDSVDYCRTK